MYDGEDILHNDIERDVEADRELSDDSHKVEDARDIIQEQKKDVTNDDGCDFWTEIDGEFNQSYEYCKKRKHYCSCGGSIKECSIKKEKVMEEKAIVKSAIVMPAVTSEEAVKAFDAYQDLAHKIMRPEDVQKIQGKEFKKKSFWRKCQRFFNLSVELIKEERVQDNGHFVYKFVARATAPNGAFNDGTGSCSSDEKGLLKTEHNCRAIAETRAKNRAIADLVAFGEVSAEEVDAGEGLAREPEKTPIKPIGNIPMCPICGGEMRSTADAKAKGKMKPNGPLFTCADYKNCKGVIWAPKKTVVDDRGDLE